MSDQLVESSVVKKDPNDWISKGEPMTRAQSLYLKALCEQKGEKFYESLTKAQAAVQIDSLKQRPTSISKV